MYCTVDKSHSSGAPATQSKNVKDGKSNSYLFIYQYYGWSIFTRALLKMQNAHNIQYHFD